MIFQLFLVFTFLAIFISAINRDTITLSVLFSLPAICLGLIQLIKLKRKLILPKRFAFMVLFVLILQLYLILVPNKLNHFYYTAIMGEGLAYWFIFSNLKKGEVVLESFLIKLTLIYFLFYIISIISNISLIKLSELIFTQEAPNRHYYFGDLAAFTLTIIIGTHWSSFRPKHWLIIGLSFLSLALSNTRSAYLSLAFGLFYIISKRGWGTKLKRIVTILLVGLIAGLFFFSSLNKTTLFSRPYFLQSIKAFPKHPMGVGMGNFKIIENELKNTGIDESSLSIYTHNLFLEALTGVGIFSIPFLIFLILLTKDLLKEKLNIAQGALVIAILTNFLFDTSYTVPGFIWIFFMAIGAFQAKKIQS